MGNSGSSNKKQAIGKPTTLGSDRISRRASAQPSSNTNLAPPRSHRRTRSSNNLSSGASAVSPPPYSITAPSMPVPSTPMMAPQMPSPNLGSRHSTVTMMPQPVLAPAASGNNDNQQHQRSNTWLRAPMRQGTMENVLETLRKYNTIVVVDDSGSMAGSRWREAKSALSALADTAAKYDTDGIDMYFLNDKRSGLNLTNSQQVEALFNKVRPQGITPIGEKLEELLLDYLGPLENAKRSADPNAWKQIKPVNYIVITDGVPTDDPESVIVAAARRLDKGQFPIAQVGIQFVQIGNEREATEYLKELDDGLSSAHDVRDMVDTTPYLGVELTADIIVKVLIGGINRRYDRK